MKTLVQQYLLILQIITLTMTLGLEVTSGFRKQCCKITIYEREYVRGEKKTCYNSQGENITNERSLQILESTIFF